MPIYEYKCPSCNHVFEKLIRNPADAPKSCPECGHKDIRKQFSSFSARSAAASARDACPAASECPSGSCCSGGSCPF